MMETCFRLVVMALASALLTLSSYGAYTTKDYVDKADSNSVLTAFGYITQSNSTSWASADGSVLRRLGVMETNYADKASLHTAFTNANDLAYGMIAVSNIMGWTSTEGSLLYKSHTMYTNYVGKGELAHASSNSQDVAYGMITVSNITDWTASEGSLLDRVIKGSTNSATFAYVDAGMSNAIKSAFGYIVASNSTEWSYSDDSVVGRVKAVEDNLTEKQDRLPYPTNAIPGSAIGLDGDARPLPKYLHALSFDSTYPEDAKWYYEQFGDYPASCSARRIGNLLERNYDWTFDDAAVFVVSVTAGQGRLASVGIANAGTNLTEKMVNSGRWSRYFKCLPGHTVDGVNECGVVAEVNVVGGAPTWGTTGTIHPLGAVRWVLDHATNAQHGAESLAKNIRFPAGWTQNFHYMIADKDATYIVENGTSRKVGNGGALSAMTNYPLITGTPHGEGEERYSIISQAANSITNVWFTKAYTPSSFPWVSDIGTETDAIWAVWARGDKESHRGEVINGMSWWQSVHTSVYDITNKTLSVCVQEIPDWYEFSLHGVTPSEGGTSVELVKEIVESEVGGTNTLVHTLKLASATNQVLIDAKSYVDAMALPITGGNLETKQVEKGAVLNIIGAEGNWDEGIPEGGSVSIRGGDSDVGGSISINGAYGSGGSLKIYPPSSSGLDSSYGIEIYPYDEGGGFIKVNGTNVMDAIASAGKVKSVNGEDGHVVIDAGKVGAAGTNEFNALTHRVELIELTAHPNMTIVGNPTFTEGNVSGFTATDYLVFPTEVSVSTNHVEFFMSFHTGSDVTTQQNIMDSNRGLAFAIRGGTTVTAVSTDGQSFIGENTGGTIEANHSYRMKLDFSHSGSTYAVKTYLADGSGDYVQVGEGLAAAVPLYPTATYWGGANPGGAVHIFGGSINLSQCYMLFNGRKVWSGYDELPKVSYDPTAEAPLDTAEKIVVSSTNMVSEFLINPQNATFSQAVLSVGIDTNTVAQIGELKEFFDGLPVGTVGTSLGGIMLALLSAVAWLKKNSLMNGKEPDGSPSDSNLHDFFTQSNSLLDGTIETKVSEMYDNAEKMRYPCYENAEITEY